MLYSNFATLMAWYHSIWKIVHASLSISVPFSFHISIIAQTITLSEIYTNLIFHRIDTVKGFEFDLICEFLAEFLSHCISERQSLIGKRHSLRIQCTTLHFKVRVVSTLTPTEKFWISNCSNWKSFTLSTWLHVPSYICV